MKIESHVYPTPEKEWPAVRYRNLAIFCIGFSLVLSGFGFFSGSNPFWSFLSGAAFGSSLMSLVYIVQNQRRDDRFEKKRRAFTADIDARMVKLRAEYGIEVDTLREEVGNDGD
jgi:hypothetical protein